MRKFQLTTLAAVAALALGNPGTGDATLNSRPSPCYVTLNVPQCYAGESIAFTLRATDPDNDALVYNYTVWSADNRLLGFGPAFPEVPSGTILPASCLFPSAGDFRIQAQAVDSLGYRGPYYSAWVKVLAKPTAPASPKLKGEPKVQDVSIP